MSTGRRTREITFNINERGRTYTGVQRDDIHKQTWIDLINSPQTQEMISTGSMLGYYGHQVRILFGLQVPETVFVAGKQICISPAVRTLSMTCDEGGNVTHRQEFLETPEGETAMRNYKAKIGGFSAVNDYKKIDGIKYPTISLGMDYVLAANYVTNSGEGMLDSAGGDFIRQELETSLLAMYDSIYATNYAVHLADENLMRAIHAENALLEDRAKREKMLQQHAARREAQLDSALCPTVSLQEFMQSARSDLLMLDGIALPDEENGGDKREVAQINNPSGWFGIF